MSIIHGGMYYTRSKHHAQAVSWEGEMGSGIPKVGDGFYVEYTEKDLVYIRKLRPWKGISEGLGWHLNQCLLPDTVWQRIWYYCPCKLHSEPKNISNNCSEMQKSATLVIQEGTLIMSTTETFIPWHFIEGAYFGVQLASGGRSVPANPSLESGWLGVWPLEWWVLRVRGLIQLKGWGQLPSGTLRDTESRSSPDIWLWVILTSCTLETKPWWYSGSDLAHTTIDNC